MPSTLPAVAAPDRPAADASASALGLTRLGMPRLDMVDALRGLVIALMVLDHVRDYFHWQAFVFSPTDLAKTTPLLFATRWVTHLCAPSFVLLAGVSIFLQQAGGAYPRPAQSWFLLTRGLWLIALELTVIVFGFNFVWPFLFLQVIWAIGIGMVAMAALIWLPRTAVLALGIAVVAGHGLLAGFDAGRWGALAPLWTLAMRPGAVPGIEGFVAYPALPWVGILCLGYGLGPLFLLDAPRRRRVIAVVALAMLAAFAILRAGTGFGDPSPWQRQADPLFDAMAFVNVSKYPPSLLYALVTLGLSLLLMVALEHGSGWLRRVLLAFGRTPLFTYLLHIYLVHGLALLIGVASGIPATVFVGILGNAGRIAESGWGVSLPVVFGLWLGVLAALYPLSRWFAGVKARRRDRWLSYL
ncbi:DUF1624 domain-containing protein [Lysobacter sp. CA196]|uniref:DUF1624 domain-containing protein n=1 Tax=Lysobacter sp. CA196 TaxID=3455606 RepID=UPI003F8D692A